MYSSITDEMYEELHNVMKFFTQRVKVQISKKLNFYTHKIPKGAEKQAVQVP